MSVKLSYGWQDGINRRHKISIFDSDKREIVVNIGEINQLVMLLAEASKDYKIWKRTSKKIGG